MATNFLVHEKIWFDKFKYDDAERKFYEQMNGPVAGASCQVRAMLGAAGWLSCHQEWLWRTRERDQPYLVNKDMMNQVAFCTVLGVVPWLAMGRLLILAFFLSRCMGQEQTGVFLVQARPMQVVHLQTAHIRICSPGFEHSCRISIELSFCAVLSLVLFCFEIGFYYVV